MMRTQEHFLRQDMQLLLIRLSILKQLLQVKIGDKIVSVNGQKINYYDELNLCNKKCRKNIRY
jgi:hypothetical protein